MPITSMAKRAAGRARRSPGAIVRAGKREAGSERDRPATAYCSLRFRIGHRTARAKSLPSRARGSSPRRGGFDRRASPSPDRSSPLVRRGLHPLGGAAPVPPALRRPAQRLGTASFLSPGEAVRRDRRASLRRRLRASAPLRRDARSSRRSVLSSLARRENPVRRSGERLPTAPPLFRRSARLRAPFSRRVSALSAGIHPAGTSPKLRGDRSLLRRFALPSLPRPVRGRCARRGGRGRKTSPLRARRARRGGALPLLDPDHESAAAPGGRVDARAGGG